MIRVILIIMLCSDSYMKEFKEIIIKYNNIKIIEELNVPL